MPWIVQWPTPSLQCMPGRLQVYNGFPVLLLALSSVAWYKYITVNNIPQHILAFHTAIDQSAAYNLKVETKHLIMSYLEQRTLTSGPSLSLVQQTTAC